MICFISCQQLCTLIVVPHPQTHIHTPHPMFACKSIQSLFCKSVKYDRSGECCPGKDRLWWHWQTRQQSSSGSSELWIVSRCCKSGCCPDWLTKSRCYWLSVNWATHFGKTSVNVSPSQDYTHPDDHTSPTYNASPGFKQFTVNLLSYVGVLKGTVSPLISFIFYRMATNLLCAWFIILSWIKKKLPKITKTRKYKLDRV